MNTITYNINLTPDNAEVIDKINKLLISGYSSTTETINTEQANDCTETAAPATDVSFNDFKKAAKAAKTTHDEAFVSSVMIANGVEKQSTLLKTCAAATPEQYEAIIAGWEVGPVEIDDDGFGDDDDLDDEPEVSADAVKIALKAYAKSESKDAAKEVMKKYKVEALSDVDKCTPKVLASILAAVT